MKLTESKLKQAIKEEIKNIILLKEDAESDWQREFEHVQLSAHGIAAEEWETMAKDFPGQAAIKSWMKDTASGGLELDYLDQERFVEKYINPITKQLQDEVYDKLTQQLGDLEEHLALKWLEHSPRGRKSGLALKNIKIYLNNTWKSIVQNGPPGDDSDEDTDNDGIPDKKELAVIDRGELDDMTNKLTESKLKQIIQEELRAALNENENESRCSRRKSARYRITIN